MFLPCLEIVAQALKEHNVLTHPYITKVDGTQADL